MSQHDWHGEAGITPEYRAEVSLRVSWNDVLTNLGIAFRENSNGKLIASCCFHVEKTPSLRFWPKSGFCCHGCRKRGRDIVAFVCEVRSFAERAELDEFFSGSAAALPSQLPLPFP